MRIDRSPSSIENIPARNAVPIFQNLSYSAPRSLGFIAPKYIKGIVHAGPGDRMRTPEIPNGWFGSEWGPGARQKSEDAVAGVGVELYAKLFASIPNFP